METQQPQSVPLVGPCASDHVRKPDPNDVRLADGSPLYYALLEPGQVSLDKDQVQGAKARLREYIAVDEEKVLECQGKTRDEALVILRSILN